MSTTGTATVGGSTTGTTGTTGATGAATGAAGEATGATGAATGATGAATGTAGAATGAATGSVGSAGGATFDTGGASSVGRVSSNLAGQAAPPPVSVEGQVSQTAGQEGSAVLHGGGSGIVEREVGGGVSVEQEATAAGRAGTRDASNLQHAAGSAAVSADVGASSGFGRAENLELGQRDQMVARTEAAEDAHAQARRIADDPAAVGTERAEMAASQKASEAMPVDPHDVQAQAGVVTSTVENPRAAAQAKAEGAVSAQEREAEVKVGLRGPDGRSREEIVGSPPTGEDDKK